MYYPAVIASIVVLPLFVLAMAPIKTTPRLRNVRILLGLILAFFLYTATTPDLAIEGAPFHNFGTDVIALMTCNQVVSANTNNCWSLTLLGHDFCVNKAAMATISHCYEVIYPEQIGSFLAMCGNYNVSLSQKEFDDAHKLYLDEATEFQGCEATIPVKLDDAQIKLYNKAYDQFLGNYNRSIDYGELLVWFWFGVMVVSAVTTCVRHFSARFNSEDSRLVNPNSNLDLRTPDLSTDFTVFDKDANSRFNLINLIKSTITKLLVALQALLFLPALLDSNKTHAYRHFLLPTRLETFILTIFLALTCFLLFYRIHYIPGDPIFHSAYVGYLRYFAIRTSILSSSITPLLILFGGRNNFLQWFTLWDYSSFITFHRWISRIAVILILFHSLCYWLYIHHHDLELFEPYVIWGIFAGLSGSAILIQGLLVLRRNNYEIFLVLHILLALIYIIGAWFHVVSLRCLGYFYISLGIWLLDRIVRIARLLHFGFPIADVLMIDDTVVVSIPRPDNWETVPGGHVFVHFLRPSCFWQSHPFTYLVKPKEITLYIKAKNGVTATLHKHEKVRVAVEGSYGEETLASNYDSAVFIAGGNGIPGIYAEVVNLRNKNKKSRITLIWVIRDLISTEWFHDELASLAGSGIDVVIYITSWKDITRINSSEHITKLSLNSFSASTLKSLSQQLNNLKADENEPAILNPQVDVQNITPLVNKLESDLEALLPTNISSYGSTRLSLSELSHIQFKGGRPNIDQIVEDKIQDSVGSTCFVTCGHPIMVDSIRAAVVRNLHNKEGKKVDYFEQLQVWA